MTKPSEELRARLRLTDEERAEIDARLNDPTRVPRQVEWADPGPDPLGMGWGWLEESSAPNSARQATSTDVSDTLPFRPSVRRGWTARRVAALAATVLIAAVGTWAAVGRQGSLVEQDLTAWVTRKLEPGTGGVRIAAPADDPEANRAEEPLINHIDRPRDVSRPAAPNVYAPIRIQEQLVIKEVPPNAIPRASSARPLHTVHEDIRPGSLFYLEFTVPSNGTAGTAVVVRTRPGPWRLLAKEMAVSPTDGTSYFGPLQMGDGEADYLVILADRTNVSLLTTVSRTLSGAEASPPDPDVWKTRLAATLKEAGHSWYGMQRIETRPPAAKAPE